MKSQGYEIVYDFPYPDFFSSQLSYSEFSGIRSNCMSNTVLCAGGAAKGSNNLQLISCGNCLSILTPTPENTAVLNNGAY